MSLRRVSFSLQNMTPGTTPKPPDMALSDDATTTRKPTILPVETALELLQIAPHLRDFVKDKMHEVLVNVTDQVEAKPASEQDWVVAREPGSNNQVRTKDEVIIKESTRQFLDWAGSTFWHYPSKYLEVEETALGGGEDIALSYTTNKHLIARLLAPGFRDLRSKQLQDIELEKHHKDVLANKANRLTTTRTLPHSRLGTEQKCPQCHHICPTCSDAECSAEAAFLTKVSTHTLLRQPKEPFAITSFLMYSNPLDKYSEFARTRLLVGNTRDTHSPLKEVNFRDYVNLNSLFTERFLVEAADLKKENAVNCIHVTYCWNKGYGRIAWGNKTDLKVFKEEVSEGWINYPDPDNVKDRRNHQYTYEIILRVEPSEEDEPEDREMDGV